MGDHKDEVVYESRAEDDFEEIDDVETPRSAAVSFIPDDPQGRVIQQTLSVAPKSDNETLKERYNRLRSDLLLLHERIHYENQRSKELRLEHVDDVHSYLSVLKNTSTEESTTNSYVDPVAHRLDTLNNRIRELEWTLGIENGKPACPSVLPLLKTLEDLKVRISILTPDLLNRIKHRLQETTTEIKSARSDKSTDSLSLKSEDKVTGIGEMYELVKKWDANCKELSKVVAHLTASRQLHEDAGRVCRKYSELMALKNDVEKSLLFQQKLDELNAKRNAERLEAIQRRVKAIQSSSSA